MFFSRSSPRLPPALSSSSSLSSSLRIRRLTSHSRVCDICPLSFPNTRSHTLFLSLSLFLCPTNERSFRPLTTPDLVLVRESHTTFASIHRPINQPPFSLLTSAPLLPSIDTSSIKRKQEQSPKKNHLFLLQEAQNTPLLLVFRLVRVFRREVDPRNETAFQTQPDEHKDSGDER